MAEQRSDRLTAVDAGFLHQEGPASHMHIGGLTVFEGPPPPFHEVLDTIRGRLHLLPRYRQRLEHAPLQSGNPVWIDDPAFNLEYHVRRTALPSPGKRTQLRDATAQIFSQRLDRSKPMWELWIIEGIETDRWAMISKTHHALIDGLSGIDIATALLDIGPEPMEIPHPDEAWQPRPVPSTAELLADGVRGAARAGVLGAARAGPPSEPPPRPTTDATASATSRTAATARATARDLVPRRDGRSGIGPETTRVVGIDDADASRG
jgi:WS/DGAT/MGAT family acyltransferase